MHKRLSLEMGGKNAMIVMDDADLDLALDGVLWGAFGTTGQRCTATSRLVLHRKIHDRFLRMLCDRVEKLRLGDGLLPTTDVGPMINEGALQTTMSYVEIGKKEGASVAVGGRRPGGEKLGHGWFYRPTVFAGVKPGSRLEQEEIFGPVLAVVRVNDLDQAIRVNNDVKYGLSSVALHARHPQRLPGDAGHRRRDHVHQRADHRRRVPPAVRRREGDGQRPPRGRLGGVRLLLRDEDGVRGLLGRAAAGADRYVRRREVSVERVPAVSRSCRPAGAWVD